MLKGTGNFIKWFFAVICLIYSQAGYPQSLFEDAFQNDAGREKINYRINGYFRSGIFYGHKQFRNIYAETSLKLKIEGNGSGNAYTEIRYLKHFDSEENEKFRIREAYLNLYPGRFDFRIGQQIIAWGRADGFNPTNNLTPVDFTVFSPDDDDKRLSNFICKSTLYLSPFSFEADWIPVYKPSVLPISIEQLPESLLAGAPDYPGWKLSNGSFALKASYEGAKIDGSLSYFNGFYKLPSIGFTDSENGNSPCVFLKAHRTQVLGADFSTTLGDFGVRGELAWARPDISDPVFNSAPNPQIEYIFGFEREWGNFNLIVQYIGKYVDNFSGLDFSQGSPEQQIQQQVQLWNRMIFSQTVKWTHSLSVRPSATLLHQTLSVEVLSLANFTTEEYYFKPKLNYNLIDNIALTAGSQLYYGPGNTLYNLLNKRLNAGFIELKINF